MNKFRQKIAAPLRKAQLLRFVEVYHPQDSIKTNPE